ncbi:type VI secretion system contractile sheath domain-containing protein [Piscinibacter sakaiensis]|uniref:type VI secretion system contractile sheath domain-containing protein n=1 Tax=Piscinibacter sakaiensis TaxID=1547922 RepID=UPI003AAAB6D5
MTGIEMSFDFGKPRPDGSSPQPVESGQLFRILVVGDFSGRASRRDDELAAPTFVPRAVDLDSFDGVMRHLAPALRLTLPGGAAAPIRIGFDDLDDFEPDRLFARLPLFARLRDLRRRLADPSTFEQAAAELRADDAANAPAPAAAGGAAARPAAEDDSATLERLLGRAPDAVPTTQAPPAGSADAVVERLLRGIVAPFVVPATSHLQQPMIDSVDRAIGETMRAILRDPFWRSLEGNWRAVDRFIHGVEMDGQVLLELVDASAADMLGSLAAVQGDAGSTPLARSLASRRMHEGQPEGYAVVVALYEFGTSAAELALLAGLGALAAREGAVLLGSAAPTLALVDAPTAWQGVYPLDVDSAAQARWQAMRSSWVAAHIGLVWPSVLSRLPYGAKSQPVSAFEFEEVAGGAAAPQLPWRLAALDLAGLLASAYGEAGWQLQEESAVELQDLPAFIDRSGDSPRLQAVAELFISEAQAQAVAASGVMPLVSHRGLPHARLATWRSIASKEPQLKARWGGRSP